MDPRASLKSWLETNDVTAAEFARRLGYDRSNFHRLLNSSTFWPTLDLAHAIERETAGAVPLASWAEAKLGPAVEPQDEAA